MAIEKVTINEGGIQKVTVHESGVKVVVKEPSIKIVTKGIQGPSGPQGLQGIQGIQGEDGSGDLTYIHNQSVPASVWIINHNLGKRPSVRVVDSGDNAVVGHVIDINDNSLQIEFSVIFGGKAYLN